MSSTAVTPAGTYWPPGVVALSTVTAHIAAFESLGYEVCDPLAFEDGYEKIAIYVLEDGTPVHASRQLGRISGQARSAGRKTLSTSLLSGSAARGTASRQLFCGVERSLAAVEILRGSESRH